MSANLAMGIAIGSMMAQPSAGPMPDMPKPVGQMLGGSFLLCVLVACIVAAYRKAVKPRGHWDDGWCETLLIEGFMFGLIAWMVLMILVGAAALAFG